MDVLSRLDGLNHLADVAAVLFERFSHCAIAPRQFVAKWNVLRGRQCDLFVGYQIAPFAPGSRRDVDYGDGHII